MERHQQGEQTAIVQLCHLTLRPALWQQLPHRPSLTPVVGEENERAHVDTHTRASRRFETSVSPQIEAARVHQASRMLASLQFNPMVEAT